ncbi:hypothetical protein GJD65_24825, partial [Klebsiella pneumoniae]|nr:hypothetical protein [Klebsiella pneumoniae]
CRGTHNNTTCCGCGSAGTNRTLKPGLPEKGLRKSILTVCFFTYNCSLLFTLNKRISNTVS